MALIMKTSIQNFIDTYPIKDIVLHETTGNHFDGKQTAKYEKAQAMHGINEIEIIEYTEEFELFFWDTNEEIIEKIIEKKI
jgi:hypothetical protein